MLTQVVLPAPLGPINPTISAFFSEIVTSSRALKPPNATLIDSSSNDKILSFAFLFRPLCATAANRWRLWVLVMLTRSSAPRCAARNSRGTLRAWRLSRLVRSAAQKLREVHAFADCQSTRRLCVGVVFCCAIRCRNIFRQVSCAPRDGGGCVLLL